MGYEIVGKFYDDIMGDQKANASDINKLIKKSHPNAKSLLEIACGTGSYLKQLSKSYEVCGLDNSSIMLSIAKNKLNKIPLYKADMLKFKFDQRFDIIICMNDSVNHLLNLRDLKKLISNVSAHLNKNGIFIFDINSEYKLLNLSKSPPIVHQFGKNYLITNVLKSKNIFEWHLRIFEHIKGDSYHMHEESLFERAYSSEQIKKSILKHFKKIKVFDLENSRIKKNSERIHFIAIKN